MVSELVIDTNVFAHCYNQIEERAPAALALIQAIASGTQVLCVDDGFNIVESRNRSLIGAEYVAHITFGSPGHYLIQQLAATGRIRVLPKRPPQPVTTCINRCVTNKSDRAFVGVAWHGADKIMVSHDFKDFAPSKRSFLRKQIGVCIIDATECLGELV